MTIQVPDSCTVDGQKWLVMLWEGDRGCVPQSASLGFQTVMRDTANWSGRIDHYHVFERRLMLFKIEVKLAPECKGLVPSGARREIVSRGHWEEPYFGRPFGEFVEQRVEYFLFDNLYIPFSGRLQLGHPDDDCWQVPRPADAAPRPQYDAYGRRTTLDFGDEHEEHWRTARFEDGLMVG